MTPEVDALRICAQDAAQAITSGMSHPSVYAVLVDLEDGPSGPVPAAFQFGFQQLLTGWVGGRLKTCFVVVRLQPRSISVTSSGTYGRDQLKALASVPGLAFPPPTLELDGLGVGPLQVLDLIRAKPLSAASARLGDVRLSLCSHDGHLAWRVLQEVPRVGFRTLVLDAADAHLLFEKTDGEVVSE